LVDRTLAGKAEQNRNSQCGASDVGLITKDEHVGAVNMMPKTENPQMAVII
jgi:hypothetical protein